jgi:hypothetical protein
VNAFYLLKIGGKKMYHVSKNQEIIFEGNIEDMREFIEEKIEERLGFMPMLQEAEDEGLEIYIHTDTYETLDNNELALLEELNITESHSLDAICTLLDIEIKGLEELEETKI